MNEHHPWQHDWDAMLALVGQELADGSIRWGADRIEPGTLRRYLEPLEIASPIHYDHEAAVSAGYEDIVAPATALLSYTLPAMWYPGEPPLFSSADANAQPDRTPILNQNADPAPPTSGFFATDMEMDFLRPVIVGERLGTRGRLLLSCTPKETKVGRGAFMTTQSEIVSDRGDVVARMRVSTYSYNPHPAAEGPQS